MIMPTVTTIISTFFQYYQAGADPYANPGKLLGNFAAIGTGANTPTPTDLKAIAESTTHPLAFLACDGLGKPLVLLMPFTAGLAGDPNQQKYVLAGNVMAEGQLPTMVQMPSEFFFQALTAGATTSVLTTDEMLATWAAHAGAESLPWIRVANRSPFPTN